MAARTTTSTRSTRTTSARTKRTSSTPADADDPFTFYHPETGQACHLPTRIRFGVLRKALKTRGDMEQMIAILEQTADAEALDAIDAMEVTEVNALVARWQEAIGASLGDT